MDLTSNITHLPVLGEDIFCTPSFCFLGDKCYHLPALYKYIPFAFACFGELIATGPVDRVLSFCMALLFHRPEMTSRVKLYQTPALSNLHFINKIVLEIFPWHFSINHTKPINLYWNVERILHTFFCMIFLTFSHSSIIVQIYKIYFLQSIFWALRLTTTTWRFLVFDDEAPGSTCQPHN